ncbi:hypothetical protein [uncultured Bacteroides sp.]|uniref:hypothetical protein n=1 Tax=uncultured Bacteroides sp. TaxID=162156 RepID=UPI0025D91515|nr:hypothetical protein [uncultured Bacteroides sp.]
MKKCILYWMFLGALSFTSCEKDEKSSDFFLSAEVNGTEISIIETHKHNRREVGASLSSNFSQPPTHFLISAEPWDYKTSGSLKTISFKLPIGLREGRHYFNNEDIFVNDDTIIVQVSLWDNTFTNSFTDYHSVDGYIEITKYSNNIIEGVFNFNAQSRNGQTVSITNGRFRTDII